MYNYPFDSKQNFCCNSKMSGNMQETFIYLSQKDFSKYFSKIADNPHYKHSLDILKEGDLYKITISEKINRILAVISHKNRVTIDEAFLLLMEFRDYRSEDQKKITMAADTYKHASALKKEGKFDESACNYLHVIDLCSDKTYMQKMKGGAYFHLADMAKMQKNLTSCKKYLNKCLKLYPDHKLAQKYASE